MHSFHSGDIAAAVRTSSAALFDLVPSLFETCPDAIVLTGEHGRIDDANDAFAKLVGYPRSELIDKSLDFLRAAGQELPKRLASEKEYWRPGFMDGRDANYMHRDGTNVPVHERVWLLENSHGSPTGHLWFIQDRTEHARAQERMERASDLLGAVLNGLTDGVFYQDADGAILGCNPAFARLVGMSAEELTGRLVSDLPSRTNLNALGLIDRTKLYRGEKQDSPLVWLNDADGSARLLEVLRYPHKDVDGRIVASINICRDITDRFHMEEQLRFSEQRYRFLAEHTPGVLLRLATDGRILSVTASCLDMFGFESDEMAGKLITDFVHPEDVSALKNLIARSADLPHDVRLTYRMQRSAGDFMAIENLMRVVRSKSSKEIRDLVCLLREIPDADLDERGPVDVFARTASPRLATDAAEKRIAQLRSIQDLVGRLRAGNLPDADRLRGLDELDAAVQAIAACFKTEQSASDGNGGEPGSDDGVRTRRDVRTRETIMLVDDEELVLNATASILARNGYNVLTATGGEMAIQLLEKNSDLVRLAILDLSMPGMNGKEMLAYIRERHPAIDVLIYSGDATEAVIPDLLSDGASAVLHKPALSDTLMARIREIIDSNA